MQILYIYVPCVSSKHTNNYAHHQARVRTKSGPIFMQNPAFMHRARQFRLTFWDKVYNKTSAQRKHKSGFRCA